MNTVILTGRLVKDPEVKTIQTAKGDMKVANFTLAFRQYSKDNPDDAGYKDCSLIGARVDVFERFVHKGNQITVQGQLHQRKYEKDGQKRTHEEIKVSDFDLPAKGESGGGNISNGATDTNGNPASAVADEDIPF